MASPNLIIRITGNSKQFQQEMKLLELKAKLASGEISKDEFNRQKLSLSRQKVLEKRTIASYNRIKRAAFAATAALVAGIAASLVKFAQFEKTFTNVVTLLDKGSFKAKTLEQGIDDLRKGVLKLRAETGESFENLNKGLFDLISAGVDASKAIDALRVATNLAIAGATTTKVAVDGITSSLNAYEMGAEDAQEVSEKLFTAQKFGKTTVEELSNGFGKTGSTAASLGISLNELLASVAAVTTGGIRTEQAYTGLAAIFANIIKPTADAAEEADRLGVEFSSTALRAKGLDGFIRSITESAKFNSTTLEKMFGSVEAVKTILALTGAGADDFSKILVELGNKEQTAATFAEALAVKNDTLAKSTDRLLGSVESFAVKFGGEFAPVVKEGFDTISKGITENEDAIISFIRRMSVGMAIVAETIADFFTGVFDKAVGDIQALASSTLENVAGLLSGIQSLSEIVGLDAGLQDTISGLEDKSLELGISAKENIEEAGAGTFAERLEERLATMRDFNEQELELLRQQEEEKLAIKTEAKEAEKEAGVDDPFAATEEDFEASLERFSERLTSMSDIEALAINKRFKNAKTDTDKRKVLESEIVKAKTIRFKAEEKLDQAIAQSAFDSLNQIVGDNKAARTALLIAEKAFAIVNILANAQQAASLALATIPPPAGEIAAAQRIAAGNAMAGIVAATAVPQVIGVFAQDGGVVPGGFGGGDRVPAMLEPGEIIVPQKFNPLSPNFEEGFGGAGQEVNVTIGLEEDASRVLTVKQREDSRLGLQE